MKKTILELRNITITIDKKNILKEVSCSVQEGDFIIIIGGNGAGKSTFFDTISGKHSVTSGEIIFNQKNITHLAEIKRTSFITRIFQNTHLNCVGSLTVLENLALSQLSQKNASLASGVAEMSQAKASSLLQSVGMTEEILFTKMNELSGGQRQLIAFVMATQLHPHILLLDEPTAALDPQASTTLLFHTKKFIEKHKTTALLITHDPLIALHMGNKVWILENGTIIKQYNEEEKKNINNPNQLIGQINYELLEK